MSVYWLVSDILGHARLAHGHLRGSDTNDEDLAAELCRLLDARVSKPDNLTVFLKADSVQGSRCGSTRRRRYIRA